MGNGMGAQAGLRRRNFGLVMRALAAGENVTRASVAAEVGLTRATVSTLVDELLAAGLVEERGAQRPGTVGRPAPRWHWPRPAPQGSARRSASTTSPRAWWT